MRAAARSPGAGILVKPKGKVRPADLFAALDECSVQVLGAEYLPLSRQLLDRCAHPRRDHHYHHGESPSRVEGQALLVQ